MQHVDEGLLHALADEASGVEGMDQARAHLTECAECRRRLEAAQAIRDRAAAILAGAGPRVDAVPFADVVARARARTPNRLGHLRTLGLAATVVLAVGVGWMARGEWGRSVESDLDAPTMAQRSEAGPEAVIADGSVQAPPPAPARAETAVAEPRQTVDTRPLALESRVDRLRENEAAGAAAAADDRAGAAPTARAAAELAPARGAAAKAVAPQFRTVDPQVANALIESAVSRNRVEVGRRVAAAPAAAPADAGFVPVSLDSALAAFPELLIIDGGRIESVGIGTQFGHPAILLTQIVDGTTVSLLEWRLAPDDPLAGEPPTAGEPAAAREQLRDEAAHVVATRQVGETMVIARAALPMATIESLLERLRPHR